MTIVNPDQRSKTFGRIVEYSFDAIMISRYTKKRNKDYLVISTQQTNNLLTYLHLYLFASRRTFLSCALQKAKSSVVSNRMRMKFGRIVLEANTHRLTQSIFDLTPLFQDGAMKSFYAEQCCHTVSAHAASAMRPLLRSVYYS